MAGTKRDLEIAAINQSVRAQKAEQKAADVNHALNLLLNGSFHLFHTALANDGNVHEFLLGTVRNYPVADRQGWHGATGETENRRLILWKTTFDPEGVYATVYHEREFRALSGHLGTEAADLEPLVREAINAIPPLTPFLVEPKRPQVS